MAVFTALYDACVLYSAPLRDVLMHLAMTDLFRAKWTNQIHEEWIAAVIRNRPELAARLPRTRALMDAAVRDCLVEGYEHLIPTLSRKHCLKTARMIQKCPQHSPNFAPSFPAQPDGPRAIWTIRISSGSGTRAGMKLCKEF
jgi:hypothetical protein